MEEYYSSNHKKKYFSHIKCFKRYKMGHYTSPCTKKKKAKKQQKQFVGSIEALAKVYEIASKIGTRQQKITPRLQEIQNLALIGKNKMEESDSSNHGKTYFSHMKYFKCHNMGHYTYPCHNRKISKQEQKHLAGSTKALTKVDDITFKIETTFSMVLCLSTNRFCVVVCYACFTLISLMSLI